LLQPTAPSTEAAGVAAETPPPTGPAAAATVEVHLRPEPESQSQGSAISQALVEVLSVVEALKHAVDQMEEALELVELAERQKIADEREIESLRRALRQLQRPRSGHSDEETRHH
jgi:hypothetical protein